MLYRILVIAFFAVILYGCEDTDTFVVGGSNTPADDETIADNRGANNTLEEYLGGKMIQVLLYGGKMIPLSQVHVGKPDKCAKDHWHANGAVTATDGSSVPDPAPGSCGYGIVGEVAVADIKK